MLESSIEEYLIECVKLAGGQCRKLSYIGRKGALDRLVLLKGSHFVEVKRLNGGKLSVHQIREIEVLRKHGASVFVISSKQSVDEFINEVCT